MLYHVFIETGRPEHWGGLRRFDLEEDRLRDQYVTPYLEGRDITTGGTSIEPAQIQTIRITRTEEGLGPATNSSVGDWERFTSGEEVTDDFITGPPGSGAPEAAALLTTPSALEEVVALCRRFPLAARRLSARGRNRQPLAIDDEYDLQYLMHALLALRFDDIRAEEWTPSYAGGAARVDFLLHAEEIVVEVKRTRQSLGDAEVGAQLLVDIARYREHPRCRHLVCFIYDPEQRLNNPSGLEADLTRHIDGVEVVTVVTPAGA